MIRETSIEAYDSIQPTLGDRQLTVYAYLAENGPLTNAELASGLNIPINQITPRTNELVKKGLVHRSGTTRDKATNRSAILWDVKRDTLF